MLSRNESAPDPDEVLAEAQRTLHRLEREKPVKMQRAQHFKGIAELRDRVSVLALELATNESSKNKLRRMTYDLQVCTYTPPDDSHLFVFD